MFYLGSLAGILPYILAFSLTLVWGGHAGMPFFTSGSAPESAKQIVAENNPPVEKLKTLDFENQIITDETTVISVPFFTQTKLPNFYTFRLFDSKEFGIYLLRAPPLSLFKLYW